MAKPEAISKRATTESFILFAKTIKTVVAGSFVPPEKESPRFFTLEEFILNVVSLVNSFFFFSRTTPFFLIRRTQLVVI